MTNIKYKLTQNLYWNPRRLACATSIEPGQTASTCSLTRLYTAEQLNILNFYLDISLKFYSQLLKLLSTEDFD
jgi:hypothetical protein